MSGLMIGAVMVWLALGDGEAPQSEGACAAGVRDCFAQLKAARESGDAEGEIALYADEYTSSSGPFCKSGVRQHVPRQNELFSERSFDYTIEELHCRDDLAVAVVHTRNRLTNRASGEKEEREARLLCQLQRRAGRWQLRYQGLLARNGEAPAPGGEYKVPQVGQAFAVPEGWHSYLIVNTNGTEVLVLFSPDLASGLALAGVRVPSRFTAEQWRMILESQTRMLFPEAHRLNVQLSEIRGMPAVVREMQVTPAADGGCSKAAFLMHEKDLLIVAADGINEAALARAMPAWERVLAEMRPIARAEEDQTPPPAGNVVVLDREGVRFALPKDWKSTRIEGERLTVSAESPDGKGTLIFQAINLKSPHKPPTAMELMESDVEMMQKIVKDFRLRECVKDPLGALDGARALSTFDLAGQRKRMSWYFVQGDRAYIFVGDAQPAEAFDMLKTDFEETMRSLQVETPGQEQKAAAPEPRGAEEPVNK